MSNLGSDRALHTPCVAGRAWHWDGVDFSILHPSAGGDEQGNDGSCVLRVAGPGGRLLLPGDLEAFGEAALVLREADGLRAEVLVVPHHGGRSSSSRGFLDAVRPGIALIPVGYRNRYGCPHRDAIRRLTEGGARIFDTARHGAITVKFDATRGIRKPRLGRTANSRIWRIRDKAPGAR